MIEVQIWKLSQPQVNLFKIDPIKSQILKMQLLYFYCYESSCPNLKGVKIFPNISRPFLSGVIFFLQNIGCLYINGIFIIWKCWPSLSQWDFFFGKCQPPLSQWDFKKAAAPFLMEISKKRLTSVFPFGKGKTHVGFALINVICDYMGCEAISICSQDFPRSSYPISHLRCM